jgi:hypothetical protein
VNAAKALGGANNDWKLTHAMVHKHKGSDGSNPSLQVHPRFFTRITSTLVQIVTPEELGAQEITDAFEALYQGENGRAGLKSLETLLPSRQVLKLLAGLA